MNMIRAIVCNGKIEIDAPADCREGEEVSILLIGDVRTDESLDVAEQARLLEALDKFEASVPVQEIGEDLSGVSRSAGEAEKQQFKSYAEKITRMFD